MLGRGLGQPAFFAIVYLSVTSAIYFSLGVVADHALGLTPAVFLVSAVFFALAVMTYVEGASLHQEGAGSTVFARYAFNELISFIAGWAILLDYTILVAVTSFSATNYLGAFWGRLGHGGPEIVLALGIIVYVAARNIRGFSKTRVNRVTALVVADIGLQLLLIVLGLAVFFNAHTLLDPIHLGSTPRWTDTIFALGVATVVFTGMESAAGLSGEITASRRQLKRLIGTATVLVLVVYVGIGLVAMTALPVVDGHTALGGRYVEAPVLGITDSLHQRWLAHLLTYVIAIAATATLIAAANSAMLGMSRLAYSLSRNRQIPSALGRLHPTRSTPFVLIIIAAAIAGALVVPEDLDFLVGIYAFGALLGLTIAHLSIISLRYREPDRERFYRVPLSVRFRGGDLPLPALLGAVLSFAAWISVVVTHSGARYVGFGWMAFGLLTYVVYRRTQGKPLLKRVIVPEAAMRLERDDLEFGSILVPLTGTPLDDDMIQTAGRLAGEESDPGLEHRGATIEAVWVFEVPMALPIDARLPDAQLERARAALRRAKAVGEEYEGVEVATATVRARRAGAAIVEEARRRGVQAIVLAAEEPSRIRGGALLGGRGGPMDNFVGEVTKYVVSKAGCEVILTAPPASDVPVAQALDPEAHPAPAGAPGPPHDQSISAAPPLRDHPPA
ncbi:amino acid permease [Baekduia soli]|uniref:Amino acid permease n=1 Tax=Baekduia soli TaxID=496014 RepID=A0A5B8U8N4_9ACTN|nr:amino acid permease [Baekduia soli]QEC49483.1 amino acid permease [Baekduia soli]